MHRQLRTRPLSLVLALLLPAVAAAQAPTPPATIVEVAKADVAQIAPRRWVPGSVVSRDVPEDAIAGGVPAKVLRMRNDDVRG